MNLFISTTNQQIGRLDQGNYLDKKKTGNVNPQISLELSLNVT